MFEVVYVHYFGFFLAFCNMEVFSLEEEECGGLFLTQNSRNHNGESEEFANKEDKSREDNFFGMDPFDFTSPCVSMICRNTERNTLYSDISDDEKDFQNPANDTEQR